MKNIMKNKKITLKNKFLNESKKIYGKNQNKTRKRGKGTTCLSSDQAEKLCKGSKNTLTLFEDEYEKSEAFIKKGIHTKSEVEKKLINMIEIGAKNPLRPQDDFYGLINNVWIKDAKLTKEQQYIIQIDDVRLMQYKVYTQLAEIIKEYVKNNNNELSVQLNNYYSSVNNGVRKEKFNYYCNYHLVSNAKPEIEKK